MLVSVPVCVRAIVRAGARVSLRLYARVVRCWHAWRGSQVYDGGKKTPLTVVEKKYFRSGESGPSEGNRFITNSDL